MSTGMSPKPAAPVATRPRRALALLGTTVALLAGCGDSAPLSSLGPDPDRGATRDGSASPSVFLSAMPPGANSNSFGGVGAPVVIPPGLTLYPPFYRDELDLYGNLAYARTPLKSDDCRPPANLDAHQRVSDQACNYYKAAGIELPPEQAVSTRSLRAPDGATVTIRRDGWGVPYVDGETRGAAQFGLGFAAAQDRLWLFDLLRNVGRGRTTAFLGVSPTTLSLDLEFGVPAGYSEAELQQMVDSAVARAGEPLGSQFLTDAENFVAGMNAYVRSIDALTAIPLEYLSLGIGVGGDLRYPPRPFTVTDLTANAVLIQTRLGGGGGGERSNLALLQALDASIGPGSTALPQAACELWRDLRHANAPDAYHSASQPFANQTGVVSEACPQTLPAGTALWDVGSFAGHPLLGRRPSLPSLPGLPYLPGLIPELPLLGPGGLFGGAQSASADHADWHPPMRPTAGMTLMAVDQTRDENGRGFLEALGLPVTTSNWLAVAGSETQSGHPIMVGGPQASYFNPQLLWEAAVISREGSPLDLAARGISTVNLPYIVIGRGLDFVWIPTSAGSDFTDTRVSRLCNRDGAPPAREDRNGDGFPDADGYVFRDQCVPLYRRVDAWTANPTLASVATGGQPVPERVERFILRTHYGPVIGTATVNGEPVVVSQQRSTFFADIDTALTFGLLTTKGLDMDHTRFKKLFNSMTSTFNWLYVDSRDIAFVQSGLYPRRHPEAPFELPVWGDGRFEWATEADLPDSYFTAFGGDASTGAQAWPTRNVPVAQDDQGYYEWPGYLSLSERIQDVNPPTGFLANWNNSGAFGWTAADGSGGYGPAHRVDNLVQRLEAYAASGRPHTLATMVEIAADAGFTDTHGLVLSPLLDRLLRRGPLSEDHVIALDLLADWRADGSQRWIDGRDGLGAMRRDRSGDGVYDHRAAVVLMDAWMRRLFDTVTLQLAELQAMGAPTLVGRQNAPGADGSAFQSGWYQHMTRMLKTALGEPVPAPYRQLRCAGSDNPEDCRAAALTALDQALADLGGVANRGSWDGSALYNGPTVENRDAVKHTNFGFLPIPDIHWTNRPTYQMAAEILQSRGQ